MGGRLGDFPQSTWALIKKETPELNGDATILQLLWEASAACGWNCEARCSFHIFFIAGWRELDESSKAAEESCVKCKYWEGDA